MYELKLDSYDELISYDNFDLVNAKEAIRVAKHLQVFFKKKPDTLCHF